MKTWVLCLRRRNDFEWTIRSRSRWNGVRRRQSSSDCCRPRVSYERTASGESQASSCSRIRAAKASATLPASSGTCSTLAARPVEAARVSGWSSRAERRAVGPGFGTPALRGSTLSGGRKRAPEVTLSRPAPRVCIANATRVKRPAVGGSDDDRYRAAVRAPRGAGDIAGSFGAQKGDYRSDLLGLRQASERPSCPYRREHLLARLPRSARLRLGEAGFGDPGPRLGRSGCDRVAANPVLCIEVRNKPRERENSRLGDRVVGHRGRSALAGGRGDVDDHPGAPLAHRGKRRANRTDEAHHVDLPHLVPLLIRELVKAPLVGDPDVVDEAVDGPELGRRPDQLLGRCRFGEICGHAERGAGLLAGSLDTL